MLLYWDGDTRLKVEAVEGLSQLPDLAEITSGTI